LDNRPVSSRKKKQSISLSRPAVAAHAAVPAAGPLARFLEGRWLALWVILLLGAFAAQAVTSMAQKSVTCDESAHLPAGYSYLARGDYRLNPEHPPLAKMIAAAPLLFMKINGAYDGEFWKEGMPWQYGWDFLYNDGNDAATVMFWGRFAMVVLSLGLGLLIFFWARSLYGNAAGLFALFLFAFSPNLIAHGSLTNTDIAMAFFFALALFCFDRALRRLTAWSAALAGLALGLALLAKFSAPLLLPVMFVAAVVRVFDRRPLEARTPALALTTWRRKAVALAALFCVMLAIAWALVWAGYRFRYSPYADGTEQPLWFSTPVPPPRTAMEKFVYGNRLLPKAYLDGFRFVRASMTRNSFLDGERNWIRGKPEYSARWPHYFIMTTLYKTPVPSLIFFTVAAVGAYWLSRRTWRREVIIIAAIVIYFAVSSLSGMYIGHRHILPVIPLAFIFMSKLANHLRMPQRRDTIVIRSCFALLVLWYVYSALSIYPNYLAYFNEIAGGPGNGPHHLTDSNIDWGQDLILLKKYMDEHHMDSVHLIYFGNGNPRYYGVRCKFFVPPAFWTKHALSQVPMSDLSGTTGIKAGDYVAISVTLLEETWPSPLPDVLERFRADTPIAKVGYSIYIYKSPREWSPADIQEINRRFFQVPGKPAANPAGESPETPPPSP
jgi:hypothetical protein